MKTLILYLFVLFSSLALYAQDAESTSDLQAAQNYGKLKPGKSKFMLRGYFHAGFENIKTDGAQLKDGSVEPEEAKKVIEFLQSAN